MSQPAKAQEPSMEEILASIRRIIADDDAAKTRSPEAASAQPEPAAAAPTAASAEQQGAPAAKPALSQSDIDAVLATPERPSGNGPVPPDHRPEADILELTEAMATPQPAPAFRTINGEPDVVFAEGEQAAAARPAPPAEKPASAPSIDKPLAASRSLMEEGLLSAATNAAVDAAFSSLARTVLVQNSRTLEDLVKEMMRPMLKAWLDDNLPNLVERMVRAEIERVSRGRG
jgi:cell pole-organizing protein PopZ